MQKACDDLFAGSGFAEQQDGRIGRGDLRRLRQHLTPLLRLADHATVTCARIELIGQRLDARLQLRRARRRFVGFLERFDFSVARERNRQALGQPLRNGDVILREVRQLFRKEHERAGKLTLEANRHAQHRSEPSLHDRLIAWVFGLRHILEDVVFPIRILQELRRDVRDVGLRNLERRSRHTRAREHRQAAAAP